MKKIAFCIMGTWLSLTFIPLQSNAQTNDGSMTASSTVVDSKPALSVEDNAKIKVLELRLTEIKEMDKSNLTFADKRNLRKEVRSINHQLKEIGGGIYISTGVIIIIIVLLIIFW